MFVHLPISVPLILWAHSPSMLPTTIIHSCYTAAFDRTDKGGAIIVWQADASCKSSDTSRYLSLDHGPPSYTAFSRNLP